MVFSSLLFCFFFLPVVVAFYYLAKEEYRNYILLIASILFYSYGEPKFVFVMLGSIIVNYVVAVGIEHYGGKGAAKKALLTGGLVVNVGILFIFKYLDLAIDTANLLFKTDIALREIALPIGISFFTFQAMSYLIDVYRGNVAAQKNPMYLALYISFFPQLIAGPIVRYSTIEEQIGKRICTSDKFAEGIRRFFLGFGKKVIIANNVAVVATEVFARDAVYTNPLTLWLGSICFSLQIFYDFSGYSDMAIGLGKMFGFEFEENFNYPYISKSVTEFWRRWHISLGQWFRDYVYIPLGGSRVSVPRHILSMFIVWGLTGIWHGANYTFLAWGLGYFVLLTIEKYVVKPTKRKNRLIRTLWQIVTLLAVNFAWVIFNSVSIKTGLQYCVAMLGRYQKQFVIDGDIYRYCREYGLFIVLGLVFSTPVMKVLKDKIYNGPLVKVAGIVVPVVYGLIFLWGVSYILLGAHNPFIYFNF